MKVENGEIIKLDNGKEYICFSSLEDKGTNYIYLISNFKPLEIRFAKVFDDESLEIINNQEEKQKVFELFKNSANIPEDLK